jgi:uncharacterized SAM-binding protein YcdF (DUF218 family)
VPAPNRFLQSRVLRVLPLVTLCAVVVGLFAFFRVGAFLADEDPLTKSDAIFVLAGTLAERPLEAADLFREGYAPRIVVTRGPIEQGTVKLAQLGITITTQFDLNQEVLLKVGVPKDALVAPGTIHDNTADEARTLRGLIETHRWRRVIIVTSKYHLRRAGVAVKRALRGTDVEIVLRGSRYDESTPGEWWKRRTDIRWIASEVPKLLAYSLGLGT